MSHWLIKNVNITLDWWCRCLIIGVTQNLRPRLINNGSKQEYLSAIQSRYLAATKSEKQAIVDEFCAVCNYNRKYAIRVLRRPAQKNSPSPKSRRGRKTKYHQPYVHWNNRLTPWLRTCCRLVRTPKHEVHWNWKGTRWGSHTPFFYEPAETEVLLDQEECVKSPKVWFIWKRGTVK